MKMTLTAFALITLMSPLSANAESPQEIVHYWTTQVPGTYTIRSAQNPQQACTVSNVMFRQPDLKMQASNLAKVSTFQQNGILHLAVHFQLPQKVDGKDFYQTFSLQSQVQSGNANYARTDVTLEAGNQGSRDSNQVSLNEVLHVQSLHDIGVVFFFPYFSYNRKVDSLQVVKRDANGNARQLHLFSSPSSGDLADYYFDCMLYR